MNIENEIDAKLPGIGTGSYLNLDIRKTGTDISTQIVNNHISKIEECHDKNLEDKLKTEGYVVLENFLTEQEATEIREYLKLQGGYNAHVPQQSDKILRKYSKDYPGNTLSYSIDTLFNAPTLVKKSANSQILSLVQSYLGCFPTLYSFNSWWHLFRNNVYLTQRNHRDHDDFRFLAFFIYLTDVDETTGPHVFYPRTQNGENSDHCVKITGKAGTAILADTFAIHRGEPLQQGERLVCWWRYGLSINKMHYQDNNHIYKIDNNIIFNSVEDTEHNRYLYRAFLKNN